MFTVKNTLQSKKTIRPIIKILLIAFTLVLVALLSFMFGSQMMHASMAQDSMSTSPFGELENMRVTVLTLGLLLVGTMIYSRMYLHWQNKKMRAYTQLLLDKTPLGCCLWDENMNLIECNEEVGRLFGLADKNEFPALFHLLSPKNQPDGTESRVKARELLDKAFAEGYSRSEWEHLSINGEPIPCDIIFQRVENKDGFVVATYLRDLREQNAMIEQIKKADEQARLLLDTAPLNCSMWSDDYSITYSDTETMNLFGLPVEDYYRYRVFDLSPKYQPNGRESADIVREHEEAALANGSTRFDWTFQTLNGELIPCEVTLIRVNHRGEMVFAAYIRDLREQIAMIEQIKDADAHARVLLDSSPLNCSLWDNNYNIIYSDKETMGLFGLPADEYSRNKIFDLSPKYQPSGRESAEMAIEYGANAYKDGYCRFDWTFQALNGEQIPCETTLIRVMHRGEYVLAAYIRDLREQIAMIEQLREADEHTRVLLNSVPLSCSLWDSNYNLIYSNKKTMAMFKLQDKEHHTYRLFDELSPRYQPNGRDSTSIAREAMRNVSLDGSYRLDWTFRTLDGELIPCDVSLVSIRYRGESMVAAYCRDLRERAASEMIMRGGEESARRMFAFV